MRGSRNFCKGGCRLDFFSVLSLFYSLQRGPTVCITVKTIYFSDDPESVQHFPGGGGGGGNFFHRGWGGVQMLIASKPIILLVIFQGEDPLWIRTCLMYHYQACSMKAPGAKTALAKEYMFYIVPLTSLKHFLASRV